MRAAYSARCGARGRGRRTSRSWRRGAAGAAGAVPAAVRARGLRCGVAACGRRSAACGAGSAACGAGSRRPAAGSAAVRLAACGAGSAAVRRRGRPGRSCPRRRLRRASSGRDARPRLGLGLGLLLGRAQHHDHVAAVLLGVALDEAQLADVLGQPLQQPVAQLGARLLAAAEHDRHLDLVAGLEEPLDVALLGAVVVRVDLRPELDLLDDRVDLVLAGFPRLHGGFVLELAEVHELGDGGLGHRGHLDQVEVGLGGQTQRVLDADDADLLTIGANQPHFRDPDAVVDARLADVVSLVVRLGSAPETRKGPSSPWVREEPESPTSQDRRHAA